MSHAARVMTQKERIETLMAACARGPVDGYRLRALARTMHDVLADAQNAPLYGAADGSVSPELFAACRHLEQTMSALADALLAVKRIV